MLELAAGVRRGARCMRHPDRNEYANRKPELADLGAANRSPGAMDRHAYSAIQRRQALALSV